MRSNNRVVGRITHRDGNETHVEADSVTYWLPADKRRYPLTRDLSRVTLSRNLALPYVVVRFPEVGDLVSFIPTLTAGKRPKGRQWVILGWAEHPDRVEGVVQPRDPEQHGVPTVEWEGRQHLLFAGGRYYPAQSRLGGLTQVSGRAHSDFPTREPKPGDRVSFIPKERPEGRLPIGKKWVLHDPLEAPPKATTEQTEAVEAVNS